MGAAVVIERIGAAVAGNLLKPLPERAFTVPVATVGDLLRPWGEVYPWCEEGNYGFSAVRSGMTGTLRFESSRRRSRRPLPAPRRLAASHKLISPELFESVQGVWDWYLENGHADDKLLQAPCNGKGLQEFIDPLYTRASDYHPLGIMLEDIGEASRPAELGHLCLIIPHYSYEDEGGGVVEAFLSGVNGVHGLLEHILGESENAELELPEKDLKLIGELGLQALVQSYYDNGELATVPLKKLEDIDTHFFAQVKEKYPDHYDRDFVLISGNGGWENELNIIDRDDIDFALAYSEAFQAMMDAMPDPYSMVDNTMEGAAETFIHEVCEVWRKANGKKAVRWVSPKQQRLATRFRKGEL